MYDLISIGDVVIDTVVPLVDARVLKEDGEEYLSLPFGNKVPVESSTSMVGGNAANNAVGVSRLGLKAAIYTNIGDKDDDEADERIVRKLKKERVDTKYVHHNKDLSTDHHVVLYFKGERTILTYHQAWDYDLPDLDKTKWVYFTSMSPSFTQSNIVEQVINYLERSGAKLAYQPGTFQVKMGAKKNARLLSLADFFILNLEEAKLFLGYEESEKVNIKKLLEGLADLGPKRVVITDGGEGSFGSDGENFYKLDNFPGKLVEATGAGDAYATGVLAGLFYGKKLSEAMRWGAVNASSVIEQIGPQAGLLSYNKMQERLKENSKIVAKNL